MLQRQLESIQSEVKNIGSQEDIDRLIHEINEPLATCVALQNRVSATFNKTDKQINNASEEDIEKIFLKLSECTRIIHKINYQISIAQSVINQSSAHETLQKQERIIVATQDENYQVSQFKDVFTQFSSNTQESNLQELFDKLINLYEKLKKYNLKKTHYFKPENNATIASLLKQTTQRLQNIISEQEKVEKEENEKESFLDPLDTLQYHLAVQDIKQSNAVDEAFKKLESADKEKLLASLNKVLLSDKAIKRELQPSILGQSFSEWPGTDIQKLAAIKEILPPAKPKIQFLAEKMTRRMKEALEGQTGNNISPNINAIAPMINIRPNSVSNFTISCQPPLPVGSTLFIRGINGNWDKGISLVEIQPNLWKLNAKDLGNQECKFLINDDKNFWEKLNGNRKIVNGELINTQGAEFEKIPEGLEEDLEGFIIFVNFGFDENKYKIAICGQNIEGRNDWDEKSPLFLANSEGCWSVQIHKKTITEPINFKYVLVPKNGEKLIWEKDLSNGSNRTIGDMTEPKF